MLDTELHHATAEPLGLAELKPDCAMLGVEFAEVSDEAV